MEWTCENCNTTKTETGTAFEDKKVCITCYHKLAAEKYPYQKSLEKGEWVRSKTRNWGDQKTGQRIAGKVLELFSDGTIQVSKYRLAADDWERIEPPADVQPLHEVAFKEALQKAMVDFVRAVQPATPPEQLLGDQKLIWTSFEQAKIGCLKKNLDYGSSAFEPPVMMPGLPPTSAIMVRMSDKIKRIQSLLNREQLVADESIKDTMRDLGTYAFLWLIANEKKK